MAQSQTDIYNLAAFKIAQSIGVTSLSDRSKLSDVMNKLWEPMRDSVLAARVWPWALRAQALALVEEDALPGWRYRYSYPNDCITAYAITNDRGLAVTRQLARFTEADYLRSVWGSGAYDWDTSYGESETVIDTSLEDAILVYLVQVTDTGRYPAQFVQALACRLAAEAAPALIGEVGLNSKQALMNEYLWALSEAGAHSKNESASDAGYVTPALAARGGD